MVDINYANAYKEVLIVLKKLKKDDYEKIPEEYILFFENNCNNEYEFKYNDSKELKEQDLLDETKYILFGLFSKFGAGEKQKIIIQSFKNNYNNKFEEQKKEKYNPDEIFKEKNNDIKEYTFIKEDISNDNLPIVVSKQNFISRIIGKIKKFFHSGC